MLDALFPKTRQLVLATLVREPERSWYLRQIAARLRVSPSSVQRELALLTAAGIVLRDHAGDGNDYIDSSARGAGSRYRDGLRYGEAGPSYHVWYRINPEFPLLQEFQSIFAKTLGVHNELVSALAPFTERIQNAFIFGSTARGERKADSDIDIIIIGEIGLADLSVALSEVESKIDVLVNAMVFTPTEFGSKLQGGNHFVCTVIAQPKEFIIGDQVGLDQITHERRCES
jgi:uncharacterized protein